MLTNDLLIIPLNNETQQQTEKQSSNSLLLPNRNSFYDGKLKYEPKFFSHSDFLEFSCCNQDFTKIAYRERNQNLKIESVPNEVSKLALLAKYYLHNKIKDSMSGAERRLDAVEANSRWEDLFGELNIKLQTAISCFIYNGTGKKAYHGEAYISDSLFGFFTINDNQHNPKGLRLCLPFVDIEGITKAAKTSHSPPKKRKPLQTCIVPLADVTLKPCVIQLWTTTKEVHQFYGFGTFFDKIYDQLINNWAQANNQEHVEQE
jgi:hypothetical protein